MSFFSKKEQTSLLGVDITSSSIKILELSRLGNIFCVESYGQQALCKGLIEDNVIKEPKVLANTITKILTFYPFATSQVALALPDAVVRSQVIQLSVKLCEQEIEELILTKMGKQESLYWDFEIQGIHEKNPALLNVLIVTTSVNYLPNLLESIALTSLKISCVDVESYALTRGRKLLANASPNLILGEKVNESLFLQDALGLETACGLALRHSL